ncbi:MAG: hypothetical protein MJ215_04685 [Spirochaetia bacterium]|nr:hypothetical protein [Spirochaetia bacterium]
MNSVLTDKSPLRVLEDSLTGGMDKGKVTVIASKKGVGKTACLVHIAIEKLLAGKQVLHVSFSKRTDYIISWYEDLFAELTAGKKIDNVDELRELIMKNRVIMSFVQDGIVDQQIINSLEAMIGPGNFKADTIIIDGYNFQKAEKADLDRLKAFAEKAGVEIWISASLKSDDVIFDENDFPCELTKIKDDVDFIISLRFKEERIQVKVVKDSTNSNKEIKLFLDPKTLLIADK